MSGVDTDTQADFEGDGQAEGVAEGAECFGGCWEEVKKGRK